MLSHKLLFRYLADLVVLLLCLWSTGASAQETSARQSLEKYAVLYWGQSSVGDEFDGARTVSWVNGDFGVPSIKDGDGFGIAGGIRTGLVAIELGYFQTEHRSRTLTYAGDGRLQSGRIDAKVFAPQIGPVEFFATGGVSLEWLSADKTYCSAETGTECRARFAGFGLAAGPGVQVQLPNRLFLVGKVLYRDVTFDRMTSGIANEGTLAYPVEGNGWLVASGIGLAF